MRYLLAKSRNWPNTAKILGATYFVFSIILYKEVRKDISIIYYGVCIMCKIWSTLEMF